MRSQILLSLLPGIYNAALDPRLWPSAIESICQSIDAMGGAYVVLSNQPLRVIGADTSGISEELVNKYLNHYSKTDPYRTVRHRIYGNWFPLSQIKSEVDLRKNEWYNDYICKLKASELAAIRLAVTPDLVATFGLLFKEEIPSDTRAFLDQLTHPLSQAARIDMEMRARGWRTDIGTEVFSRLALGVVVINEIGQVVEVNPAAEAILARHDGLSVRQSRIVPGRAFEAARFDSQLAATLSQPSLTRKTSRMLVGRAGGRRPYTLTLVPSTAYPGSPGRTYAILLIDDPESGLPSEDDLAELYGLSPAESRLAALLARGKRLPEIGRDAGVKITTLRTQMRSILKKVNVERSADLLVALSSRLLGRVQKPDDDLSSGR
jgi:DNA-binding CsgD family transcriptional regulator